MRNFQLVGTNIDPLPVLIELHRQPELWDANPARQTYQDTPHADVADIWVRWRPGEGIDDGQAHELAFLPPWYALPSLRPLVFGLMARTQAVELGGILMTRIPPGGQVQPHVDGGWHAHRFETKVYLVLQGNPDCVNHAVAGPGAETESLVMQTGTAWLFRNTVPHSVANHGGDDRISLIVCMRCES